MKTVLILGTLDTKGEQLMYLRDRILGRGLNTLVMDLSMGSDSSLQADITPGEIVSSLERNIADLRATRDRSILSETVTEGARIKTVELLKNRQIDGIVALGGTTMALLGARVMQLLPFGFPKLIGTTAAMPAYIGEWFASTDLSVMQLIMEITGMNDLLKNGIERLAGAISGMVEECTPYTSLALPFGSIAMTEIGFSQKCARQVESLLHGKGYEVYSFHAQGISDRAMDRLIADGFFDGVVEIVPAGLIEEFYKGNRAAGMERLDAAGERGIPQVIAPCCLNLTGCGPTRINREKYAGRMHLRIDEMRAMTRFIKEELITGARLYAEKLNKAKGPLKFVIPLKGWSSIDSEGSILYNPEDDRIFVKELLTHLNPSIQVEEVDCNLEEPQFSAVLADSFDKMFRDLNSTASSSGCEG